MNSNISAFSTTAAANFGGLTWFEYVPKQWISSPMVPDATTGDLNLQIGLTAGRSWLRPDFAYESCRYQELPKNDKGKDYFEAKLSCRVDMDATGLATLLAKHRWHEYVVRMRDRHGVIRVCGNRLKGMKMSSEFDTGEGSKATNRFLVVFSLLIADPAPYYTYTSGGGGPDPGGGGSLE